MDQKFVGLTSGEQTSPIGEIDTSDAMQESKTNNSTDSAGTSGLLKATAMAFAFGLPLTSLVARSADAQTVQPEASPTPGDPGDSSSAALCDSDPVDNPDITSDPGQPDNGIVTTDQTDGGPVGDGGPGPGGGPGGDYGYF